MESKVKLSFGDQLRANTRTYDTRLKREDDYKRKIRSDDWKENLDATLMLVKKACVYNSETGHSYLRTQGWNWKKEWLVDDSDFMKQLKQEMDGVDVTVEKGDFDLRVVVFRW